MKGVEIVGQVAGISAPAECLRRLQRCFYVHNARRYDRRRRRRSTREAAAQREMAEHEDFLGLLDAFESLANVIYPPLPGSRYHCARCSKLIAGVVCKGGGECCDALGLCCRCHWAPEGKFATRGAWESYQQFQCTGHVVLGVLP